MTFDEWLENDLSFWEALECGLGQSRNAKLLRLVRAQRELLAIYDKLAGAPGDHGEQLEALDNKIVTLEAALMGEK